jgi:RNA polymerase sigma-70 factor (ECF subfamily)
MSADDLNARLSSISTHWSVLRQAHEGNAEAAAQAQDLLMRRYGEAIRRYLLGALRDEHAADELTQEFALSLVRGSFRGADPQRGRFRYYLKVALCHLVSNYHEARRKGLASLPPDSPALADLAAPPPEAYSAFDEACREDLLARTWDALADTHPTYYAVLRFKAAHPQMPSEEMAGHLSVLLEKPLTADGARQALHRARELYGDLLVEDVARQLDPPTPEAVMAELNDLNLLSYCKPALDRYARKGKGT